jgi:ribosomal protein S18 acetylase RimI-like enzyme
MVDLTNVVEAADRIGAGTTAAELRIQLDGPGFDKERGIALWEEPDGRLAAMGALWLSERQEVQEAHLWLRVHPSARGADLERDVFEWAAAQLRQVASERGMPARLRLGTRDDNAYRIGTLERNGFTNDRYFFDMARLLDEPLPDAPLPEGFSIRHLAGEHEVDAWVEMFNQTFIDHWNHADMTVERRKHWMQNPEYLPGLDLVAVAPDGTLAAFSFCIIEAANNQRTGDNEGWVADLGTRRGYRKIGLARALLAESMRRFKAAGLDTAKLGVDAQNPNGALRLYESVGFRKVETWLSYVKNVV